MTGHLSEAEEFIRVMKGDCGLRPWSAVPRAPARHKPESSATDGAPNGSLG